MPLSCRNTITLCGVLPFAGAGGVEMAAFTHVETGSILLFRKDDPQQADGPVSAGQMQGQMPVQAYRVEGLLLLNQTM